MSPPMVYDVTIPSAHSTSKMMKIVQSMFLYSFQDYGLHESVQTKPY